MGPRNDGTEDERERDRDRFGILRESGGANDPQDGCSRPVASPYAATAICAEERGQ